uniref:Probable RNA-binding protein EIF1AD n=1 Tax=Eptatretus burgeri TaxID=7764 RepID=A0A8C4QNW6_EPTBU
MSKATKRKYVVKEVMEEYVVPSEQQQVVRVSYRSPGNNLHEVETALAQRFLVSMPPKYRKNIWIKRGNYLIVDPIEEGDKVKGEIAFILYRDHIKHLKHVGEEEKDDDSDLFVNTNRKNFEYIISDSESNDEMPEENAKCGSEEEPEQ